MLKVNDICSFYGDVQILHGVSLDVKPGEMVTLLGSNGAGTRLGRRRGRGHAQGLGKARAEEKTCSLRLPIVKIVFRVWSA